MEVRPSFLDIGKKLVNTWTKKEIDIEIIENMISNR